MPNNNDASNAGLTETKHSIFKSAIKLPWRTWQLYTLKDMLTFAAHDFQALLAVLPELKTDYGFVLNPYGEPLPADIAGVTERAFRECLKHCNALGLTLASQALNRYIERGINNFDVSEAKGAITDVASRIHDSLEAQLFLHIDSKAAGYYMKEDWMDLSALLAFPSIEWEAREAATCYALERYTACLFHLMRILEYGLASLASALGVTITNPNWHHIFDCLREPN